MLWVGGCTLDYNVSSGPVLSYEIEIGDGPGPELDNILRLTIDLKLIYILKVNSTLIFHILLKYIISDQKTK